MKLHVILRKTVGVILAASLCFGLSNMAMAQSGYNDFESITSHVNLKVPGKLRITRPSAEFATTASAYFITGDSNPEASLSMDGQAISTRGTRGSFGIWVGLETGVNTFTFSNGGQTATVTIRRGNTEQVVTINNMRSLTPDFDCATFSGKEISLSCTAPSGASVTAVVGGRKVPLKQAAATSAAGVPATFSAKTTAGEVNGTLNLGPVTYTMSWNGKTMSQKSAGSVFLTGSGDRLLVQVKNTATSLYQDDAGSAFIETPKYGALDSVAAIGGSNYQLSTGGWIPKTAVMPLTENYTLKNDLSAVDYEVAAGGEYITLAGTTNPMFRAYKDADKLYVKLFRTTVSEEQAQTLNSMVASQSKLFSGVDVTTDNGAAILTFHRDGKTLWGYDISYNAGTTTIYAKYAPAAGSGALPLKGVTVAVDAGHGGTDPGAIGIPGTDGAMEKDITLATAMAVQKRLESLGATTFLCREGDSDVSMNDRMKNAAKQDADLFISLHCNSVGYAQDANKVAGAEVYYFEPMAKNFATTLSANVAGYTGRNNRGARVSNYRVTLNSFAPSVLVEMGFLTNPAEYDSMASKQGIFQTANAVGDSVIALFA